MKKIMRFGKGLIAILVCSSSAVFSQKAMDNLAAPAPVRIDGKLTEWNVANFQVNKPTTLSYAIANDQRSIYLVIHSADSLVNSRIMLTGITFMINQEGKKREGPLITFPFIDRTTMLPPGRGAAGGTRPDPLTINRTMLAQVKEIKLSGFKDITDERISIYNEHGIKGAGTFDDQGNFIYEMAIPMTLLGLTAENAQEVAYNIKINGSADANLRMAGFGGAGGFQGGRGGGDFQGGQGGFQGGRGGGDFQGGRGGGDFQGGQGGRGGGNPNANANRFYEATDFWVNMKLVKP